MFVGAGSPVNVAGQVAVDDVVAGVDDAGVAVTGAAGVTGAVGFDGGVEEPTPFAGPALGVLEHAASAHTAHSAAAHAMGRSEARIVRSFGCGDGSVPRDSFPTASPDTYTARMHTERTHTERTHTTRGRDRSPSPHPRDLDAFRGEVRDLGRVLWREMPWRDVDDPYAVLVSEVMLQQTQVARVMERYPAWLAAFPTLEALDAAPLAEVLGCWQGLGYNRRALALKRAAEMALSEFGGALPANARELRRLPGVGPATAAAVVTYAFRLPEPFIETNVRAVFLHRFFAGAEAVPDSALMPIVEATWDSDDPRGWGYALMDYGSWLKRALPDPSRRGAKYARQGRFEGSRRQSRAAVLRAVLAEPGLAAGAYAVAAGLDGAFCLELLAELAAEGFLSRSSDRWEIAR